MQEKKGRILWIDNQISDVRQSSLQTEERYSEKPIYIPPKPYIPFLESQGYTVSVANSTTHGITALKERKYDAVLLNYDGPARKKNLLSHIRNLDAHVPILLLTRKDGVEIRQEASLYDVTNIFITPTNPPDEACKTIVCKQLAASFAFLIEKQTVRESYMPQAYVQNFNSNSMSDSGSQEQRFNNTWQTWVDTYINLLKWDLQLDTLHNVDELKAVHRMQKNEANAAFASYIQDNYSRWLMNEASPVLSVDVVYKYVIPEIQAGKQVLFVVMDCMRLDHWLKIEPLLYPMFDITTHHYYSILPTATRYARNAIFSGLFPLELAERYPHLYAEPDKEHTSINRYEKELLRLQLQRHGIALKPPLHYFKIFDTQGEAQYSQWLSVTERISLEAIVVDFLDMLTHTRYEADLLRQLIPDEAAFHALVQAWFQHSWLYKIFRIAADRGITIVLTSDHGSLLCQNAAKISSQTTLTAGLRFKEGKHITCDPEAGYLITDPETYRLPGGPDGKNYILAKEDYYFVYEKQFNVYKELFYGSFQHGGISLEEMILPCVVLEPR